MAKEITMGREVYNIPFGDIIREVALGIAEAQFDFDKTSMLVAEQMSGRKVLRDPETGAPILDPEGKPQTVSSTVFFGYDLRIVGEEAVATANVAKRTRNKDNIKKGEVTELEVVSGGSRYDYPPGVEIRGDGTGAAANAIVENGVVTRFEMLNKGADYTEAEVILTGGKTPQRFPRETSMIELGFVPNFYQFVDTVIEMKLALRVNRTVDNKYQITTSTVDANYASSYNYALGMATTVKTKIVPIPPPTVLEDRIRQMMDADEAVRDSEREIGDNSTGEVS